MYFKIFILGIGIAISHALAAENAITRVDSSPKVLQLSEILHLAQENDPWLAANRFTQDSVKSLSIAAGSLPDPKVSVGLANLATDSFEFNQEAMTQIKLGVSQMFPRGDSLAIKKRRLENLEKQFPFQREDRKAKVTLEVTKLWLEAYKAQQSIALIESDRALFEQLVDVAAASYSSAVGKTRQHDLVRAQLELTRLDDRLTRLNQTLDATKQGLAEWMLAGEQGNGQFAFEASTGFSIASRLPKISLINKQLLQQKAISTQALVEIISQHPAVLAFDQKIKASESSVELAKQKYKPEWGVSASYGYRDASPLGQPRSDLFSVGVSFDLPIFTENKQDQQLRSATSKKASIKTQRWLILRKLIASYKSTKAQLLRLIERQKLFEKRLLPQMHDQAEASLTAYTNDDGDFAEVVRSRIAELNARIDALIIDVDIQKNVVQLNYFLINSKQKNITPIASNSFNTTGLGDQND